MSFPTHRLRRLRTRESLRRLVRETRVTPDMLVAPLFVCQDAADARPIGGMPGQRVLSVDELVDEARALDARGVGGVILFGVPRERAKDECGQSAADPDGAVPRALRALASEVPRLARWVDVCLCAYTTHGHCGVLADASADKRPGERSDRRVGVDGVVADGAGADGVRGTSATSALHAEPGVEVDNDRSLPFLSAAALAYAEAGAEVIAPSDMMDGRVGAIRRALDDAGQVNAAICSYAAKYASAFYGPFREAANSKPAKGDRRGYQMDPANADEALREVEQDLAEGADIVMVKPALAYLDVLYRVKERFRVPTAAYNVSGEYAMLHAAAERGWLDRDAAALETLLAIRRAGADIILTYWAKELAARLS